ncbi:hypothetical protein [Chromobacterium sp. ATCC 53434]|uniref:hypothetical protein n=1 Tax=Chromobacterium sp. (strain ATCC 53434 / SC 14030) TaxID=2059672 RepID=UPI0013053A9D|nr:hypothetical protein [Chromobacterium sp. ATCC 53434]
MPVEKLAQASIDHAGTDYRLVELFQGDVTMLPATDAVEFLAVFIEPGKYESSANEVVGRLAEKGVNLQALSQKHAIDLRPTYPCWISEEVDSVDSIHFRRLLVFEIEAPALHIASECWKVFRALQAVTKGKKTSIAIQAGGAGQAVAEQSRLLRMLFFAATRYGSVVTWPLESVKLFVHPSEAWPQTSIVTEFKNLTAAYNKPPITLPIEKSPTNWKEDEGERTRARDFLAKGGNNGSTENHTPRQIELLKAWTANTIFKAISQTLYANNIDDPGFIYLQATIEGISSALANLPNYTNDDPTLRGANLRDSDFIQYKLGANLSHLAFTSASIDHPFPAQALLKITSESGKRIEDFSMYPDEGEVLFDRGMTDIVTCVDGCSPSTGNATIPPGQYKYVFETKQYEKFPI